MLFITLKECKSKVQRLSIRNNQIDDGCMKLLGQYLQNNQHLNGLYMNNSQITDKSIEILVSYLDGNTTLKDIDFSSNKGITGISVSTLSKIIESSHIENINIAETSITQKNALVIPLSQNMLQHGSENLHLFNK